ncbi:MAG: hypothetical protein HYR86_01285, partial [Candidatus Rokubacteria bacterium]|nr:hypothetical protein [Candidatus Rokubacteria bacterium]
MAPPSALARVARIGPWLASVVCPGLIAIAVARHAVNVPYWDEWHLTPEVEHVAQGRLSLAELWAQHNEHRPVLPKLVMLALARLSRWDTRWESAASVAVALALLVILAALIAATVPSKRLVPWLVLVASALTFSKGQFENW